jgi:hypothetical protein
VRAVLRHGVQVAVCVIRFGCTGKSYILNSSVLTSYIESLARFGEKGADRAVELIGYRLKGIRMPLRSVMSEKKTLRSAKSSLMNNVARVVKPRPYKISKN